MLTESPIFVGGLFKSGTTLLRSLIGQHSRIASGLETYWFDLDWSAKQTTRFAERIKWLATFYSVSPEALSGYLEESGAEAFLDQLLSGFARAQSKSRWAEKTPGNILHMDRILAAWPQAKIVHIIRDPRDVFASLRQSRKWDSIEEFMARWTLYLGSAEGFKQRDYLTPCR